MSSFSWNRPGNPHGRNFKGSWSGSNLHIAKKQYGIQSQKRYLAKQHNHVSNGSNPVIHEDRMGELEAPPIKKMRKNKSNNLVHSAYRRNYDLL